MTLVKDKILEIAGDDRSKKILGVGLPRTGTTSLKAALDILGYRTVHSPRQYILAQSLNVPFYRWDEVVSTVFKNKKILEWCPEVSAVKKDLKMSDWDAMVNFGEHIYPMLDKEFSQSKFILTIRDKDEWIESTYFLFRDCWPIYYTDEGKIKGLISLIRKMHIFQNIGYNEDEFSILYDNHLRNVKHYFKGREQDLFIMDLCGGEGWERLCQFLGKEVPDIPFPHKNKRILKK